MTVDISAQLHARNRFNVIFATWQSGFICPVINKNRAKNGIGCVFVGPRTHDGACVIIFSDVTWRNDQVTHSRT